MRSDDRPSSPFPAARARGTFPPRKTSRRGDWAVQWLLPALAGGWSAWAVSTTPSGANMLRGLLLFALALTLDPLLGLLSGAGLSRNRLPRDTLTRDRQGGVSFWRMFRRALVFFGAGLLAYALSWLALVLTLASFIG